MIRKLENVGQSVRVSVVIPTHNRAKILPSAIRSALDQTTPVFEILVCDDGSADDSKQVVNQIHDPRIKWISGPHSGLPAVPRNRGLRAAKGEWIAMLDSDDQWATDKVACQIGFAREHHYLAISTNGYRVKNGKKVGNMIHWPKDSINFFDLLRGNQILCSSVIFHRSLLPEVIGFPQWRYLKSVEDFAFWLRIATIAPFGYISNPLVLYRDDEKSSVRKKTFYTNFQQQIVAALSNYSVWYLNRIIAS